jgi:hypothetical protein
LVREYDASAVAATAVGYISPFQFLRGTVDELITCAILDNFGPIPETSEYSRTVDSWSLLAFAIGTFAIGLVIIAFTKDTDFRPGTKSTRPRCCQGS